MTDNQEHESPIEAQLAAPPVMVSDDPSASGGVAGSANSAGTENPLHSRLAVFGMLFLVTGALGIPLLWMSPNFSNTERVIWAIVVTIYTAVLVIGAVAIVMWSWRQIFG